MSKPRRLSISQARRLTLGAQGFADKPDPRGVNRRDLRRMMGRLKLLQLDSVPVIIRTQYLPAFSRLGPYRAELLDEIAYRDDEWFEAWAHEASLMPVEREPQLRWLKARARNGQTWKGLVEFAKREAKYIDAVYDEVSERGPLLASELSEPRRVESTGWGRSSQGAIALGWMFRTGQVGIRRVGNFEKQFDVLENIISPEILGQPTPSEDESVADLLVAGAEALGVGTANCLVDYFRLPARVAKPLLPQLVEDGRLLAAEVEGWDKPAYLAPGAKIPRSMNVRALVSPFDPVVWFRDRGEQLFDFHYRIEIYVPAKKRKWGYYVLPFVLGEEIVARVDVKTDRKDGILRVPAAHLEPGHDAGRVAQQLAAELHDLARFVGVDRVQVGRRGDLADTLRAAVKHAGSR